MNPTLRVAALPAETCGHSHFSGTSLAALCGVPCVQHGVGGSLPGPRTRGTRILEECLPLPPAHKAQQICLCFLELSKSQNDMSSDKQQPATGPRQSAGQTERRSQSDTAINVATRVPLCHPPPPEFLFLL